MSVSFSTDIAAANQKAGKLNGYAAEFDLQRRRLLEAATSVDRVYQGADSKTYIAKITECCNQMKEVSEKLRRAAEVIKKQQDGYGYDESEQAAQASRL